MSALRWDRNSGVGSRGTGFSGRDGRVLPRLLRKPVRFMARMLAGDVEPPRYAATMASAAFLSASVVYGAIVGGHMPGVVKEVTARTGFAVEEVRITGNREVSEIDVFAQIGLDGWTSLIGFDAADARARILELPWVEQASVRKVYPAALEVRITEKVPFAIWQQGRQLTLIEEDGAPIAPLRGSRHKSLPLVVGYGAADRASSFVPQIRAIGDLGERVRGFVRVADRRWNLQLDNGLTIKLPEEGAEDALRELVALDGSHQILSRDLVAIDLRLPDRFVLRLGEEAAEARETALKERLGRAYQRAERQI